MSMMLGAGIPPLAESGDRWQTGCARPECGIRSKAAGNEWPAVSPPAEVVYGVVGCRVSINDMADRAPRALSGDDILNLGGKRLRFIERLMFRADQTLADTGTIFGEETSTPFCGDLYCRSSDAVLS